MTSDVFQNSPKSHHAFGQFCEKNYHQELSKIAQSGHTAFTATFDVFVDQHKGFANAMLRQVCLHHFLYSCGQCYKASFEANCYFEVSSLAKIKMIGR